ncbi:MAG: pyruvate dehydrogenase complex dihydrolipoamide acetyltransferase [Phycisphaeraceae bacterium]|nr:pyruvate dehydrogenase complex dihydrolipoamide acetyltransferase [Phycisphaerales bacterium]MCB9843457.1 pyruvate dehydrogenase complex dihydrolipoamide acetyltransferase [Phycisphaeraceae bacterium]
MPRLSDTMEQGTIVSWNVKEGDKVSGGDVLGDIETDKATMELQNFDEGTVAAILLPEGTQVNVGQTILVLATEGEDPAEIKAKFGSGKSAGSSPKKSEPKQAEQTGGSTSSPTSSSTAVAEPPSSETKATNGTHSTNGHGNGGGGRVFASPLAKKIATEKGIDLATIEGTGPSGRIVRKDVEHAQAGSGGVQRAASAPAPIPMMSSGGKLESKTVALNNMRATIAKRLVESKTTIPHYQVTVAADMDALLDLREQLNTQLKSQGVKLSVNDFLVRACALAMHQHPFINASWGKDGKSVNLHAQVNIGVAVALSGDQGGGLVVASLRNADQMGLRMISAETKRLAEKARTKGLTLDEMDGSTFTISNLGMFSVEHFTAIINPPNSAILAVGAAVKQPVVMTDEDGEDFIAIGHRMQMTMSSDHRVIDGAMAAAYLATVREYLEAPATLLV